MTVGGVHALLAAAVAAWVVYMYERRTCTCTVQVQYVNVNYHVVLYNYCTVSV